MNVCNREHPLDAVCLDRRCVYGERNPFVRMQRRLDRLSTENRNLKQLWFKQKGVTVSSDAEGKLQLFSQNPLSS